MAFEVAEGVERDEWERAAEAGAGVTFFQTPAWLHAYASIDPRLDVAVRKFVFEDGRTALLPLLAWRRWRGLATRHDVSVAGCYAGWLAPDGLDRDQAHAIVDWATTHLRTFTWRIAPFSVHRDVLDGYATRRDTTEVLMLEELAGEEDLERGYKPTVRNKIRKAVRAGLAVRRATSWDDWERYYGLYEQALARWGDRATTTYPRALFRALHDLRSDAAKLWLVTSGDEIVGGSVNFDHAGHVIEWHAAFDERFFSSGARNFLVHRVVLDALGRGGRYYDFHPSGGNEGTRRFKQSHGSTAVPANVIDLRGPGARETASKKLRSFWR